MNTSNSLRLALTYSGIPHKAVADALGVSPANFSQKLKRNSFSEHELAQIAEIIGAKFIPCAFEFPDGKRF